MAYNMSDSKSMRDCIHNLILLLFEDNMESYKGIDEESFVTYVCRETGLTKEQYCAIMRVCLPR